MADARHDLGLVVRLNAEAVGRPGQRRFRVLAEGMQGVAAIWLEKEQLHSLALSIVRLLEIIASEFPQSKERSVSPVDPPQAAGRASLDFQSGSWSVGYDEAQHVLEFLAHDLEDGDVGPARVRFWTTLEQSRALSEEALQVYGAGRPLCLLCEAPLNEGETHVCPRGNGHAPQRSR